MSWILLFDTKNSSAWEDGDRFIHLLQVGESQWAVRVGLKSSTNHNQEAVYKNRSRALISVKNLLKSKKWNLVR